jgi:signal transduction histidine kinase
MASIPVMQGGNGLAPPSESWDVLPIGLCVVDHSLKVIHINGSMKQILSSRDNLNLPLPIDLLDGQFAASMNPVIGRVLQSRRLEENVEAVLHRATETRHLLVTAFPLERNGRATVGLAVRDITSFNHAVEPNGRPGCVEVIQGLAAGIAHNFNNLLTVILANASLIPGLAAEHRSVDNYAGEIVRSGERAAELTRQMLAFSGKGAFFKTDVRISELVHDAKPRLFSLLPETVSVRMDLERDLPPIKADATQIADVIDILFRNALEALDAVRGGRIEVATGLMRVELPDQRRSGHCVYLQVTDDGCGIDDETLPKIFNPFFTTKFPGRGLSLAAVQGIAAGCGGEIRVSSRKGSGSTFRVIFPI